jgi:hypothetical protein
MQGSAISRLNRLSRLLGVLALFAGALIFTTTAGSETMRTVRVSVSGAGMLSVTNAAAGTLSVREGVVARIPACVRVDGVETTESRSDFPGAPASDHLHGALLTVHFDCAPGDAIGVLISGSVRGALDLNAGQASLTYFGNGPFNFSAGSRRGRFDASQGCGFILSARLGGPKLRTFQTCTF